MVGGFFAGQLLIPIPVVGGVIGTVIGGFAGGLTGSKISVKIYEQVEQKMEKRKQEALEAAKEAAERAEEEQERQIAEEYERNQMDFTYEYSLEILGVTAEETFSSIYNQYLLCYNNLQAVMVHEAFENTDNLPTKKLLYSFKKALEAIQNYRLTFGSP